MKRFLIISLALFAIAITLLQTSSCSKILRHQKFVMFVAPMLVQALRMVLRTLYPIS